MRALVAAAALCGAFPACRAHAPVPGSDGRTRVECEGEPGDEVRLSGSHDGWRQGPVLNRDEDGRYLADLALPPGFSAISCVRLAPDGSASSAAPLNAPVVEPDGFGGENGLFEGPRAEAQVTSKE